jgi:hypothetical protein
MPYTSYLIWDISLIWFAAKVGALK